MNQQIWNTWEQKASQSNQSCMFSWAQPAFLKHSFELTRKINASYWSQKWKDFRHFPFKIVLTVPATLPCTNLPSNTSGLKRCIRWSSLSIGQWRSICSICLLTAHEHNLTEECASWCPLKEEASLVLPVPLTSTPLIFLLLLKQELSEFPAYILF